MTTASDLTALGWRGDNAIKNFQHGWALGPRLEPDGNDGPTTRAAIAASITRLKAGLPTASANFSFTEFRCACRGQNPNCDTIWVRRELIQALEKIRALTGPLSIERGCRCPLANGWVGGAKNSQHLYGTGVDITVFDIPVSKIIALGVASGIGTYRYKGVDYFRHVDVRHIFGLKDARNTTPGVTVRRPARWSYGNAKSKPVRPNPGAVTKPTPPAPTTPTSPQEDDDMFTDADRATLKSLERLLVSHDSEEDGRYAVDTGRYSHLAGLSRGIAEKVGADDVDESAIAAALAPLVADAVKTAATEAGIASPEALANAVVAQLGTALTQENS